MRRVLMAIGAAFLLLAGTPLAAETDAEAYDRMLAEHRKVQRVKFRDDHTDVAGKGYELAKSTLSWFGVPGTLLDGADFVRSVKNEGVTLENTGTFLAKYMAQNIPTEKFKTAVEKMGRSELINVIESLGVDVGPDLDQTTGNLQKFVLEYMTEVAPKVAAKGTEGGASDAAAELFLTVLTKACKTCDLAQKSYEFAREAAMAAELAFDNQRTQEMFARMENVYQFDQFRDMREQFVESRAMTAEARKALTLMYKSLPPGHRNYNRIPTEEEVERYIFQRFQRWRTEIERKERDAEILEDVRDFYLRLLDYEKEAMFGAGSEADWAAAYQTSYLSLWDRMLALRGDNPWPIGGGEDYVRWQVDRLLKQWKTGKLNDAELTHEMRKLAAGFGWMPQDKVGPPPPKPAAAAPPTEEEIEARQSHVIDRLSRLNHHKLSATMAALGVEMPVGVLQCLCAAQGLMGAGLAYHPEPWGDCDNADPCKGGNWGCVSSGLPSDPAAWKGCIASQPVRLPGKDGAEPTEIPLDALIEQKLRERKN